MKSLPQALRRDELQPMSETSDAYARALGILDAYWSMQGWPSMQDTDDLHDAISELWVENEEDYNDARSLVHDAAVRLGWNIEMVNDRVEKLVRPGTP